MELNSKGLAVTFVVMGFSCSISQVLLAREFMTIFSGNEFVLGVLFVNWLLCIALGSWSLGRLADRPATRIDWLAFTLIGVSIILPAQIVFLRSILSWVVAERGEMAGFLPTFYSTFLVLLPFCSLHGLQFSLGCSLAARRGEDGPSLVPISTVYVLEALGSVIGGLAFTYFLVRNLRVLEISVGLSLMNLLMALVLQGEKAAALKSNRIWKGATTLLIVVTGLALLTGWTSNLETLSYRWQWKGLGLVHSENSVYGNIAVTQSGGQLDFWVNGLPMFTAPDPDKVFVEEVVHFPMLQHPSPDRVLLIGGGLGGVLEELLKHPVSEVTYVELDPSLIEVTREYSPDSVRVLEDPIVEVAHLDGRLFVKKVEATFDVAIVNLPSPSTLQLNRFYTLEFFTEIRGVLDEEGVLSFGLTSSLGHMSDEMRARNRCIHETVNEVFPSTIVVPGEYNLFIASPGGGDVVPTYDADVIIERLQDRGLVTSVFTADYIRYKFSPERREIGLAYLQDDEAGLNRDTKPVAVFHDLALWNAMFHPHSRVLFSLLSEIDPWRLVLSSGILAVGLSLVLWRRRRSQAPIYVAVLTTGIAGMTSSIVMLYSFQALCGYLYQELGVLTASFMLGAALGGWLVGHRFSEKNWGITTLCATELTIIAYSLLAPLVITRLSQHGSEAYVISMVRWLLPVMNGVAGFLVGMEFPMASGICLKEEERVGGVTGALYASDLLGACAGSLMAGIWLVPLHGIVEAFLMVGFLNVASLMILYGVRGRG